MSSRCRKPNQTRFTLAATLIEAKMYWSGILPFCTQAQNSLSVPPKAQFYDSVSSLGRTGIVQTPVLAGRQADDCRAAGSLARRR
jgi:hypothetical protein